jgi:DNA repair exonuclease SbcCD ATPase subunit
LRRNRDIVANGQGAAQELRELRRQVTESERRIEDKRSGITTILTETNEELRAQMNNFELNMQTRTQEQRNLQRSVDMLQNEIAKLRASTEDLNIKRGQGQSLKQSIGESQKKLVEECSRIARQLDMQSPFGNSSSSGSSPPAPSSMCRKFIQQLNAKVS